MSKESEFQPYTAGQSLPEFTAKALITGILLGMVFGAANTYLGLKAGLTISTSIPIAVLTVIVFRLLGLVGVRSSILELNMSQTVGSSSSSVASGVLFTIPALFIWNMAPSWRQMTILAACGGLLGVLAMIPLRRYLIKQEHGKLPYPEGTACAEVLKAAERGGRKAIGILYGFSIGIFFKLLAELKMIPGKWSWELPFRSHLAASTSPALLGVGYILGIRVAGVMVGGGLLAALVITPAIYLYGRDLNEAIYPSTELLIRDMTSSQLWLNYVRYIGAGAVATGGFLTLIKSIPTMIESFRAGLGQIGKPIGDTPRTDHDLPLTFVGAAFVTVLVLLTAIPGILGYLEDPWQRGIGALLVGVFAFFFVTVSARIVGLVGVTSNPTSGMTIATLLGTSLVFYWMGWTDMTGKATALMVGTSVCIAASIAGDTSQDLKTGFLLGATPRYQQIGELLGVITSAGVVCWVLQTLNASTPLGGEDLPAPQAMLMRIVIDGVLDANLPWPLIGIGAAIAVVAALCRLPVLAFAVGVYLPLETMGAVFVGGFLRYLTTRRVEEHEAQGRAETGVLLGSGMVGGAGLTGVIVAMLVVQNKGQKLEGWPLSDNETVMNLLALFSIAAVLALMTLLTILRKKPAK